jgi:hypothetical protein
MGSLLSARECGGGFLRPIPRRWVVERFIAWINRNRRLAKDFEATITSATAFPYAACVVQVTRRLARSGLRFESDPQPRHGDPVFADRSGE